MNRARSTAWLAFPLGLAIGWFAGAWAWVRWTPFSLVRLAQARVEQAGGAEGWVHAPSPHDPGGSLSLRPELEIVLASALVADAPQRIRMPLRSHRYLTLQLMDERGVTLAVLTPGDELELPAAWADGGPLWCIARARILPGEEPDVARARIDSIQFGPALQD